MKQDGLLALLRSDFALKRHWFLHHASWFDRRVRLFLEPGTLAVIVYRLGHWATELRLPVVKQLLLLIVGLAQGVIVLLFGIFIDRRFQVGRGFAIHNFGGIFISASRAGDNFILFHGVTVGHLRGEGGRPPRFGSNVFLGAGAKVMGDLAVGNNVVVGANSLVIDDVLDRCTVIGVPARIFDRNTTWIEEKLAGLGDHW